MAETPQSPAAPPFPGSSTRRVAYAMLVVVAASIVAARILTAPGAFSVNDVSRWATVRALVDTGSYSIGRRYEFANRPHADRGIVSEPEWETIDLVMDPNTRRFYS